MPDVIIILFLMILAVVALVALFKGIIRGTGFTASAFIVAGILWGVTFGWLRFTAMSRVQTVDWFFLQTIEDGSATFQVFVDGKEVINATELLGAVYPEGTAIERKVLEPSKYGITFECLDSEAEYRAILPNEGGANAS